MTASKDRLYDLLPAIYRQKDVSEGYPLRALLQVISEQVNIIEADIDQLYENWFIETCQDWVVPYIGDLIGYQPVHDLGASEDIYSTEGTKRTGILIPRSEVANTVRYRRSKGTSAILEELARDITGWPAHIVEFYRTLGIFQNLNHLRMCGCLDLREVQALDLLDGPFDEIAHSVDLRRRNIPNVGVFVWRLKSYSVTKTHARKAEMAEGHFFTFSALKNNMPLYTNPKVGHQGRNAVPEPITLTDFKADPGNYYGEGKSFVIWIGIPKPPGPTITWKQVPLEKVQPADLSNWSYVPDWPYVAVDPERGRFAFSSSQISKDNMAPEGGAIVSYFYGFCDDIGGGEYERPICQLPNSSIYRVGGKQAYQKINDALAAWQNQEDRPKCAIIEIEDSGVYTEPIRVIIGNGERLQLRAGNGVRPVLRLLNWEMDLSDSVSVVGKPGSKGNSFTMDGLIIAGNGVQIGGDLAKVSISHSTLIPGWRIDSNCEPKCKKPSLRLYDTKACLKIDHSILGSIQLSHGHNYGDLTSISIMDSIIDATGSDSEALGAHGCPRAHVNLTMKRSTILGEINVHSIDLAENSIFYGAVRVARRQLGCMRFCYVSHGSITPRRYNCQPDLATEGISEDERPQVEERVRPQFNSVRYGTPRYCQLSDSCPVEIKAGADDESEMGVYHDLFEPQREASLRIRLDENTPAGMDVRIIHVD